MKKQPNEDESTKSKKPKAERSRKVRLYLSTEQKEVMRKWFGTVRWTYNQCVDYHGENNKSDLRSLRDAILKQENYKGTDKEWVLFTDNDVRDNAIQDFVKAVETTKLKGHRFEMKRRTRKDRTQSIVIRPRNFRESSFSFRVFKGMAFVKSKEGIPSDLVYDSRITLTRSGKYYLNVLKPLDIKGENQAPNANEHAHSGVISLDPGVRTFMTGYDPSGKVMEWGKSDITRIFRLCKGIDALIGKHQAKEKCKFVLNHRRRYKMKKAEHRARERIRHLLGDCHKKLAKWLCENYRVVLIPKFDVSHMVKRRNRKIRSKTVRQMVCWSHYAFRQRLKDKSREYPWIRVIECTEEYTSKTCGRCGWIHQKLGSSKVYDCRQCATKVDRDWNGARNILLKWIEERRLDV
jgi:putative transposase